VIDWVTKRSILLIVPSCAKAQDEAAIADFVGCGGHLREQSGITERRAHHKLAKLDSFGGRGQGGLQAPGFVQSTRWCSRLVREHVVKDPNRVHADGIGAARELKDLFPRRRAPRTVTLSDWQDCANAHLLCGL
jgi:hypothetical protein